MYVIRKKKERERESRMGATDLWQVQVKVVGQ